MGLLTPTPVWLHGLYRTDNILVFMHTSNDPFYSNGASARLAETTNDTGEVVALAVRLGERLWRDGFRYSKTGIMTTELMPETIRQPALRGDVDRERRERAWKAMDKLDATLGRDTVCILGAGPKNAAWKLRAEHPCHDEPQDGMNCLGSGQTDKTIPSYRFMLVAV